MTLAIIAGLSNGLFLEIVRPIGAEEEVTDEPRIARSHRRRLHLPRFG